MKPVRIAIMASGRGSNARAILTSCKYGEISASAGVIISNNRDAGVHSIAQEFGIPSYTVNRADYNDGKSFAERILGIFKEYEIDLILLAGYMRKIPPAILRAYPDAILNIHPALLPKHGGKGMFGEHVHRSVLDSGDKETGVTVHYVNEEYDKGNILHQESGVWVLSDDTVESLAKKVLKIEHEIYTRAVKKWIDIHWQ